MRHRFCSKRVSWHWMYILRAFLVFFFSPASPDHSVLALPALQSALFLFLCHPGARALRNFSLSSWLTWFFNFKPCLLVFRSHLCIAGFLFPFAPLGIAASFLFVFWLSLAMLELRPFLPPSASLASCLVLLCIFAFVYRIVFLALLHSPTFLPSSGSCLETFLWPAASD